MSHIHAQKNDAGYETKSAEFVKCAKVLCPHCGMGMYH